MNFFLSSLFHFKSNNPWQCLQWIVQTCVKVSMKKTDGLFAAGLKNNGMPSDDCTFVTERCPENQPKKYFAWPLDRSIEWPSSPTPGIKWRAGPQK
jgi:hypothetical protein